MKDRTVGIAGSAVRLSNSLPLTLVAGPCVIESETKTLALASSLKRIASELGINLIFKASYDKANRSSIFSYRGPGLKKGLAILSKVKEKYSLPVLTDVHSPMEAREAAKFVDIIQVPAFLCRQTDLVAACAITGLPVNIKKGQFIAPEDVRNIIEKIERSGGRKIIITERGTSFGYHDLVVDFRSLPALKETGYPVIFDATHSVQTPQGGGVRSGGKPQFIEPLSLAAAAIGVAGIFVEVHPEPAKALSDGANSVKLSELERLLKKIIAIDRLVKIGVRN